MKYKDFEGTIQALVDRKLDEIEEMEGVKILHAVESGSRAWGFASPDSDYDVRFVYVRPEQYYLRLDEKKDFINWELDETLDINGWDLSKTLQHFHKSNASLYEQFTGCIQDDAGMGGNQGGFRALFFLQSRHVPLLWNCQKEFYRISSGGGCEI